MQISIAVTIVMTIFTFCHLAASTHIGQDFLYLECVLNLIFSITGSTVETFGSGVYGVSSCKTTGGSFFSHLQNLPKIFSINFLIIFLFLNFVKEIVSVFSFPLSCIFYIPFGSLYLPIRYLIFYCKRWYIPYYSIIWLCRIVAVI